MLPDPIVNAQSNFREVQAHPRKIPCLRPLRFCVGRTAIATSFAFPSLTSGCTDTKQEVEDYNYELTLLEYAMTDLLRCARRVSCPEGQRNFILSLIHRLEQGGLDHLAIVPGGHVTYLRVLLDQALRTRCVALGYCAAGHPAKLVQNYLVSKPHGVCPVMSCLQCLTLSCGLSTANFCVSRCYLCSVSSDSYLHSGCTANRSCPAGQSSSCS